MKVITLKIGKKFTIHKHVFVQRDAILACVENGLVSKNLIVPSLE